MVPRFSAQLGLPGASAFAKVRAYSMGETPESPASPPEPRLFAALRRVPWLAVLTVAAALATTLGSVSLAGIWDSPEVVHAEWSRRIAHDVFGAGRLGAPGEAPLTREALGRGELPFLSIALGLHFPN